MNFNYIVTCQDCSFEGVCTTRWAANEVALDHENQTDHKVNVEEER